MAENKYLAAWAFLQGGLETLQPLIAKLDPAITAERVNVLCAAAWQLIHLTDQGVSDFAEAAEQTISRGTSRGGAPEPSVVSAGGAGGVFFPFGMEQSSRPGPTDEDIEAMLRRENGALEREDDF